jgi:hypothetical protein
MALRIRRGLNAVRIAQTTPAEGELIYTTDTKKLFVGDGSTLGGIEVSGVNAGDAGSVPYYNETGTEINSGTNLKWNENSNTLSIVHGLLNINNELGRRALISLDSNYSSYLSSVFLFRKSKGSSAVPLAVNSTDELGSINFAGYTGIVDSYSTAATIQGYVDVAPLGSGTPFTINFVSKTGTGPYYVTFSFVAQSTAPVISRSYTISGNSNTNYNTSNSVTASTTTQMTLLYPTDPGLFGTGVTQAKFDAVLSGGVQVQVQTVNGNLLKALRISSTGLITIGSIAADFTGVAYDPGLNGQLVMNSNQTSSTLSNTASQLSLRTYANTTYAQTIGIIRGRGTLVAPTPVVSGDQIHTIKWSGSDGTTSTSTSPAAQMIVSVDDTVTPGHVPGAVAMYTSNAITGTPTIAYKTDSTQQTTFYGDVRFNYKQLITVNYLTPATTGTYNLSTTVSTNILLVGAAGLTLTLNMPTNPELGQTCTFTVHTNATTLALGTGTVLPSFAGVAVVGKTFTYVYRTTNWYSIG